MQSIAGYVKNIGVMSSFLRPEQLTLNCRAAQNVCRLTVQPRSMRHVSMCMSNQAVTIVASFYRKHFYCERIRRSPANIASGQCHGAEPAKPHGAVDARG